jgi:beta-N-acetylhexosaminidase
MNTKKWTLDEKIGQLMILGFQGLTPEDKSIQKLAHQIRTHQVGGVIPYAYNITDVAQITHLNAFLQDQSPDLPLIISVDQEGGKVQRLKSDKGFRGFPTAEKVASLSPEEAHKIYLEMATELNDNGFNLDFAPCVDLNPESYLSPIIGELERSYSSQVDILVEYAALMMDALHQKGILNSIKHFPGHGSARGDTHKGFVDVTQDWSKQELLPFFKLIQQGHVDTIMTAHVFNDHWDKHYPATFSASTLQMLRDEGYEGIIISDDLHMTAIHAQYDAETAMIKALKAGNDMVIFSNYALAAAGVPNFKPDPDLPEKIITAVKNALSQGELSESRINEAFDRVLSLKRKITA